jgi:hypothetical protein
VLGFDSVISISLADDGSQTEVEDEDRAALDLQEFMRSVCGDRVCNYKCIIVLTRGLAISLHFPAG